MGTTHLTSTGTGYLKEQKYFRWIPHRFKTLNPNEGYKINDGVLKLGAEIEDYKQIKIWGYNSLDIAHAVRRAQTINSEIKSWGLKYITQFSNSEKPNRVYVDGDKIASTYRENKEFYLNVQNGKYKAVGGEGLFNIDKKVSGCL